jgi:replicative DNA helicase
MTQRFDNVRTSEEYVALMQSIVPHSEASEKAILGAIILDNALVRQAQREGLEPYDMHVKAHHVILRAMYALSDAAQEINPIILGEELRRMGHLEVAGGVAYISELTYGVPYSTNLGQYIKVVKGKSALRAMRKTLLMRLAAIDEQAEQPDSIIAETEHAVATVAAEVLRGNKRGRDRRLVTIVEDRNAFNETLSKLHKGQSDALPTGYRPIDNLLEGGGLQPQGFYIVAAMPKAGKTTWVLNIGKRVAERFRAERNGKVVGIITLEMRRMALIMRLFSAHTQIPFNRMTRPGFRGPEYEMALLAQDEFFTLPIAISDAISALPEMAHEIIKSAFGSLNLGLIILDYIQLMSEKRGAIDSSRRTAEVTAISLGCKHLAQETNLPLIAVSSLNREVMYGAKDTKNKNRSFRPEIWHLRESGQIEYDAEAIFLLHNPDLLPGMEIEKRKELNRAKEWNVECILAAQRNGPIDDVPLKFLRESMTFLTESEYNARMGTNGRPSTTTAAETPTPSGRGEDEEF